MWCIAWIAGPAESGVRRTLAAQRGLVQQFMQHRIEKVYTALVSGYVAEDGEIDLPLYFNSRLQRAEVNHSKGKPSLTRYHIVERLAGHTVLECRRSPAACTKYALTWQRSATRLASIRPTAGASRFCSRNSSRITA